MSEEFNIVLKNAYNEYRDHPDPPVPLELIKEYLEYEGIFVDENNDSLNKEVNDGN